HWRYAKDLAERFPALRIDVDALFLKDGRFYTSAGITAGIDLALALIEEDLGRAASVRVARDLVVYLRRSGGQTQYSEPLQFEALSGDRLAPITEWITTNLHRRITLDVLARHMNLSPRQVSRHFKAAFGATPAGFVEHVRMKEAQRRLVLSDRS